MAAARGATRELPRGVFSAYCTVLFDPAYSRLACYETQKLQFAVDVGTVTLQMGSALGTIRNDDGASITITGSSATEGDAGASGMTFTVSLSNASTFPISSSSTS